MMKQDLFVLTDRRLVLNHCIRIISSSFIIYFNSVRESWQQNALVSSAKSIYLSTLVALGIYVEKKKQWSKIGTLRYSTLDISKRRKSSIALDLLSSPRQIICRP